MAKNDKAAAASSKANRGQDENMHVYVQPDSGERVEQNQRWFRETGRDLGYVSEEDFNAEQQGDAVTDESTPETPA